MMHDASLAFLAARAAETASVEAELHAWRAASTARAATCSVIAVAAAE